MTLDLKSASASALHVLDGINLIDAEAIRLLLSGGSVIDWRRLAFRNPEQVGRFLRVNEFRLESPADREQLEVLREYAVDYLRRKLEYRVPEEVASRTPVPDLFLLASSRSNLQPHACTVLKVMHVVHHLIGRELLFKLPIADDEAFSLVEEKVVGVVDELRSAGHPIVEFAWSRKERDSIVTKLLAKKDSIAASVFDKLRFRLVTRTAADLVGVLVELTHRLIPFNYLIPGESVNRILSLRGLVQDIPAFARVADQLQHDLDWEARSDTKTVASPQQSNEFSGPGYRVINFVADLPIRMDAFLDRLNPNDSYDAELGAVGFVLTEFQMMDAETAQANQSGENSHEAYKTRQHERVRRRLLEDAAAEHFDGDEDSE